MAGLEVVVHCPSDGRLKKETLNKVETFSYIYNDHFCKHSLKNIFEEFSLVVVSIVSSSKAYTLGLA